MIGYRTGGMVCCGKNEGGEIRLEGGEEGDATCLSYRVFVEEFSYAFLFCVCVFT